MKVGPSLGLGFRYELVPQSLSRRPRRSLASIIASMSLRTGFPSLLAVVIDDILSPRQLRWADSPDRGQTEQDSYSQGRGIQRL